LGERWGLRFFELARHRVGAVGGRVELRPVHANGQVPLHLLVVFFKSFHRFIRSLAQLLLKSELLIRFPDFFGDLLVVSLLLPLDKIAETVVLLALLQLFPGILGKSVVHLHSFFFELDERAASLSDERLILGLHARGFWAFDALSLGDLSDLDQAFF